MEAHLQNGAALLGDYKASSDQLANWMSSIDDSTLIQNIPGIPGTHDTLACQSSILVHRSSQADE